jgi:Zn-dependent peptidase ImmA (M78 family)
VTAQALSKYEHDMMMPSSGVLRALAGALGVSVSYLLSPEDLALDEVEFRRHALSAKDAARVEAAVIDRLHRYLTVEDVLAASSATWVPPDGAPYAVNDLADAEMAAARVRAHWQLGLDPLPHVAEFLEEKGIKVLALPMPESVHGLCAKVTWRSRERVPVVVVNDHPHISGERERFTLCHELGHLLLECGDDIDVEKASHRFAGAFLVPAEVLWREVGRKRTTLSVPELEHLKRLFGVSMYMITMRCREVGIIAEHVAIGLFRQFKAWGWKAPPHYEPHALPVQRSERFPRLCFRALSEGLISTSKAAELLDMSLADVDRAFSPA